jgi:small GTP-binding protein
MDRRRKVIFLGDSGVGKTSLIRHLTGQAFNADVNFSSLPAVTAFTVELSDRSVSLDLWDTAGQEAYRSITVLYFRDSVVALVCGTVPVSSQSPLDVSEISPPWRDSITRWADTLRAAVPLCPIILVTTKSDLLPRGTTEDLMRKADALVRELHFDGHFLTSARTGHGIKEMIDRTAILAEEAEITSPFKLLEEKATGLETDTNPCQC